MLSDESLRHNGGIVAVVECDFERRLPFTHGHVHNTVVHLTLKLGFGTASRTGDFTNFLPGTISRAPTVSIGAS